MHICTKQSRLSFFTSNHFRLHPNSGVHHSITYCWNYTIKELIVGFLKLGIANRTCCSYFPGFHDNFSVQKWGQRVRRGKDSDLLHLNHNTLENEIVIIQEHSQLPQILELQKLFYKLQKSPPLSFSVGTRYLTGVELAGGHTTISPYDLASYFRLGMLYRMRP